MMGPTDPGGVLLMEDGTIITRAFITGLYNRLVVADTALSYRALLEENPRNVWAIPLLFAAEEELMEKVLNDASPGDELDALRRLKSE